MGLLDKVEKKEQKVIRLDVSLPLPSEEIKKHIEKKIKKEETDDVDKPTVQVQNNSVVVLRP